MLLIPTGNAKKHLNKQNSVEIILVIFNKNKPTARVHHDIFFSFICYKVL